MSLCLSHKVLVFNEHCFPRINYFKTRLMRFYPRMKNVLNYEFNTADRGVKRMRSDDAEVEWIGDQIERKIELGCMATNAALLNEVRESEIAIKPEYAAKEMHPHIGSEVSKEFLQNNVIIIMTTVKDLADTVQLVADADWMNHAILAIFDDASETSKEYKNILEKVKMNPCQKVIIKSSAKEISNSPVSGENTSSLILATGRLSSESLHCWDSLEGTNSQTDSQSSSHSSASQRHNLRSRHTMAPSSSYGSVSPARKHMQSLRLTTRATLSLKQTSSADSTVTTSPSSSTPSSPVKTRPPPTTYPGSEIKKSKLGNNDRGISTLTDQKNEGEEPMDLHDSTQNKPFTKETETVIEKRQSVNVLLPSQNTVGKSESWDMEELSKAVSFQLEVHIVSIINRITILLKSVRSRRDPNAEVAAVTTLDKLIYEIEGLLGQSITESGIKMKEEIEKNRIAPIVTTELLRVKGVYGCGTMYDRLNVHIEASDGNEKEAIQKEIKKVTDRHNYKDTEYDVRVVKSRPTMYGRLVICSG